MNNLGENNQDTRYELKDFTHFNGLNEKYTTLVEEFNRENVLAFNQLIKHLESRYAVEVVMITSWNNFLNVIEFRQLFKTIGIQVNIKECLIGEMRRCQEVYNYIKKNNIVNYVILDDEPYGYKNLNLDKNFIQTDFMQGLTNKELEVIKKIY